MLLPRVATGSLTVAAVLHDDTLVLLMGLGTTAGIAVMAIAASEVCAMTPGAIDAV